MYDDENKEDEDKQIEFVNDFTNKAWFERPSEAINRADDLLVNRIEPKYYFDPRIKGFDCLRHVLEDKAKWLETRFAVAINILIIFGIWSPEVKYNYPGFISDDSPYWPFNDWSEYDSYGKEYDSYSPLCQYTSKFDSYLTSHMFAATTSLKDDLPEYEND